MPVPNSCVCGLRLSVLIVVLHLVWLHTQGIFGMLIRFWHDSLPALVPVLRSICSQSTLMSDDGLALIAGLCLRLVTLSAGQTCDCGLIKVAT